METDNTHTADTLPSDKLVHYLTKDEVISVLGDAYPAIVNEATVSGLKPTSKYLKSRLLDNNDLVEQVRETELGARAAGRYNAHVQRLTNPATKAKSQAVRAAMVQPRHGFLGCVATKIKPKDLRNCVENYDAPEYQTIDLVPHQALKQSVYAKTRNPALAPTAAAAISELPKGLQGYIRRNPEQFDDYLEEKRAEVDFLRAVRRNAVEAYRRGQTDPAAAFAPLPPRPGMQQPFSGIEEEDESDFGSTSTGSKRSRRQA